MTQSDPLVQEFLVESYENLDQLDQDLLALEQNPRDATRLASVFRTIHTIKGTCGFFGFNVLEAVTHVGENLLSMLRDGTKILDPEITSVLLRLVDSVRQMLRNIEATGVEGTEDHTDLINVLSRMVSSTSTAAAAPKPPVEASTPTTATPAAPVQNKEPAAEQRQADNGSSVQNHPNVAALSPPSSDSLFGIPSPWHKTPSVSGDSELLFAEAASQFQRFPNANQSGIMPGSVSNYGAGASQITQISNNLADSSVRVDVSLLDKLMTLVGELVLARNQILQYTANQNDSMFQSTSQRLNLITSELQEGVMKTRMQQIGNIWNKFPRIVRDLAGTCGKQIRVEMDGQETELDRTIIEAIKDPLTHVVRNAVDHGIEAPHIRSARKKPAEGKLSLKAYHEGGRVNIEINDDGGGIDPEKVKAKAIQKGLLTREVASQMSEQELIQLIFLPGFSTAEKISNISGRGVGMDVVKTNIEKIGGSVELTSIVEHGTSLRIKIPLTLAIIPALTITVQSERYAIPQVSLLELVRLEGESARHGIEMIRGTPIYRLRGRLLPLVYLDQLLGYHTVAELPDIINIVILQADGKQFGLVVDEINDTEEIVVKPLSLHLKQIPVYSGATIMGDGKVALILDVTGIARNAGILRDRNDKNHADKDLNDRAAATSGSIETLLLVQIGASRRVAVKLEVVDRLEEIPADSVENADGNDVIQYRGAIMPLIRLGDMLGDHSRLDSDVLQVLVHTHEGHSVGLVVDRILDVIHWNVQDIQPGRHQGVIGSVVLQDRVTDLLDLTSIISNTGLIHKFEMSHS